MLQGRAHSIGTKVWLRSAQCPFWTPSVKRGVSVEASLAFSPVVGCCGRWNRSRKEGEQVVRFRVIGMLAAGLMLVGGALGSAQAASGAHRPTGVVHSQ